MNDRHEQKQPGPRSGGQILIDQLKVQGADHVFLVPGESYLAALDALHDSGIKATICRQEGGAAMMAEAAGKLTGRPGICFVTRGPGATNASPGIHIAQQDSTPMILFVGQVGRDMRGREAFQELDYRAVFGAQAKWATEIDNVTRIPEIVARAYSVAMSGRPGPVVISLPEDMLRDICSVADARRVKLAVPAPTEQDVEKVSALLAGSERPIVIAGGGNWRVEDCTDLVKFAEAQSLPVATSFRRQPLFPNDHANYAGDLGVGCNPALADYVRDADLILLLGGRLSEIPSQGYEIVGIPVPRQTFVHVHPGSDTLNSTYQCDIALNVTPGAFLKAMQGRSAPLSNARQTAVNSINAAFHAWTDEPMAVPGSFNLGEAIGALRNVLPRDAVICNGAGNYATWVHRFHRFTQPGTQLAPTSGSMGYGTPAAVAAARLDPDTLAVAFAGDGCFLMNGQEFATAVQYSLRVIVVVVDNGMYGTIRMHQETNYPGRVSGTDLKNPDFAALARAYGGHGERVEKTADFLPAFERARASGLPALIHCVVDPQALTVARSLDQIRSAGEARKTEA